MASCSSILLLEMIQRHCHERAQNSDKKNNKKRFPQNFNQKKQNFKVEGSSSRVDHICDGMTRQRMNKKKTSKMNRYMQGTLTGRQLPLHGYTSLPPEHNSHEPNALFKLTYYSTK